MLDTNRGLRRCLVVAAVAAGLALSLAGRLQAAETFITVASTTSTDNSGLFSHLLPLFERSSGIKVRVVAVGTGQAIRMAKNGDADVLLVHHKKSEEAFVAGGFGVKRFDVMYNDFVILGPDSDPAGIHGMKNVIAAFKRIAETQSPFASRGDDSGTHKKERDIWKTAGIDTDAHSGTWYRELGSGMGATLNSAVAMGAYVMSDRATWIAFNNKGGHRIDVEGDRTLFNQYGVILVDPKRHPHVKQQAGQRFVDWLVSANGQAAIADYRRDGKQLFFPNARPGS